MRYLKYAVSLAAAISLLYACTLGLDHSANPKSVEVEITCTVDGPEPGGKNLISDTSVESVDVTAEDSSGTVLATATLTKGATSWKGSMNITVEGSKLITFRARAWSNDDYTVIKSVLYYGTSEVTVTSGDTTLNVNIGTAVQTLAWTNRGDDYTSWESIASSVNGTKLAATIYDDYITTSADSGLTWVPRSTSGQRTWGRIASSSDGTKLAAFEYGRWVGEGEDQQFNEGAIYTSADSGATWVEQTGAGLQKWLDIACSSDGTKLFAAPSNGVAIHASTDSGATWSTLPTPNPNERIWTGIACSSDGQKLAAIGYENSYTHSYIYTSSDSGATWTERTGGVSVEWQRIASSADGAKLIASEKDGYIYTSSDSGANWIQRSGLGYGSWGAIAISADGTRLIAAYSGTANYIYTSRDSGVSWTEHNISAGNEPHISGITCSSDGAKIAFVVSDRYLYTAGY